MKTTIEPGQTLLVYKDKKVLVKKVVATRTVYISAFPFFVGDASAVDAKIAELGLS
jgi:hypothetical protein